MLFIKRKNDTFTFILLEEGNFFLNNSKLAYKYGYLKGDSLKRAIFGVIYLKDEVSINKINQITTHLSVNLRVTKGNIHENNLKLP